MMPTNPMSALDNERDQDLFESVTEEEIIYLWRSIKGRGLSEDEAWQAVVTGIALDMAFQCAPDHPWVKEHPAWFKHRPDGSIQYAEENEPGYRHAGIDLFLDAGHRGRALGPDAIRVSAAITLSAKFFAVTLPISPSAERSAVAGKRAAVSLTAE